MNDLNINSQIKYQAEQRIHQAYSSAVQSRQWLDYPQIVSIETFSKCNAKCVFCPYVQLERIGTKLTDTVVYQLIDEIATFPTHPQRLNFTRVNEPFLDKNIFDYLNYASRTLPKTNLILFSNGQPITDKVIDNLNAIPTFKSLTISFNEHDPYLYQQVMGIDQSLTIERLTNLHTRHQSENLNFSVTLSRVGSSTEADIEFLQWTKEKFPSFPASSYARFLWVSEENESKNLPHLPHNLIPDAGCLQWFSLHILSNGESAFCCIDGFGSKKMMSIDKYSLYEIYNDPSKRVLRDKITSRKDVNGCQDCIHGMPSNAYIAME